MKQFYPALPPSHPPLSPYTYMYTHEIVDYRRARRARLAPSPSPLPLSPYIYTSPNLLSECARNACENHQKFNKKKKKIKKKHCGVTVATVTQQWQGKWSKAQVSVKIWAKEKRKQQRQQRRGKSSGERPDRKAQNEHTEETAAGIEHKAHFLEESKKLLETKKNIQWQLRIWGAERRSQAGEATQRNKQRGQDRCHRGRWAVRAPSPVSGVTMAGKDNLRKKNFEWIHATWTRLYLNGWPIRWPRRWSQTLPKSPGWKKTKVQKWKTNLYDAR